MCVALRLVRGDDDTSCLFVNVKGVALVRGSSFSLNSGSLELGSPSQHHAKVDNHR
jgi:hypothetical protein